MKSIRAFIFNAILCLCTAGLFCAAQSNATAEIYDLRCNNIVDPLGVEKVLLSWKINSERPGMSQSGWQVQIAESEAKLSEGEMLWDSGKVTGSQMFDISPDRSLFKSGGSYWWRVRVWDEAGAESG